MKGFAIFVSLIVVVAGAWMGVFSEDSYSGKETFRTEQEYTLFKEVLSNPDIYIISMQSLSSDPPIVATFELTTPKDMEFPYGEKDNAQRPLGYILAVIGFAGLLVVLIYSPEQVND